jgi:hypothetical protein
VGVGGGSEGDRVVKMGEKVVRRRTVTMERPDWPRHTVQHSRFPREHAVASTVPYLAREGENEGPTGPMLLLIPSIRREGELFIRI